VDAWGRHDVAAIPSEIYPGQFAGKVVDFWTRVFKVVVLALACPGNWAERKVLALNTSLAVIPVNVEDNETADFPCDYSNIGVGPHGEPASDLFFGCPPFLEWSPTY
jgi:hypothetical protein